MRTLIRTSAIVFLFALPTLLSAQSTTRTVLLEQFTGTWCQWCPYGAEEIDSVLILYPNARAIAYHQGDPMSTSNGDNVIAHLLVSSYPSGAIDRRLWNTPQGLGIAISRSYWRSAVSVRDTISSPMSIGVSGTYHQDTRLINATVTLNALSAMSGEYYLNIILTEDGLNYAQKKNVNGNVVTLNPYYHKRVVRDMITGWVGDQLTTTGFTANQMVTYPFTFSVPSAYDISNLKLTVFVTTKVTLTVNGQPQNKSMNIVQAFQKPLTGTGGALTLIPVEMISFNAKQIDDGVRLAWRTAKEDNNRGWYVERRTVGGDWQDLGFVEGYGTTTDQQAYEYTDHSVAMDQKYDYRLRQIDFDGSMEYSSVARVYVAPTPTETRLLPNYPNPFNPATTVAVEMAQEGPMTVEVYDMLGRRISTLADGNYSAGLHTFEWNGTDEQGVAVESGIYFARFTTAGFTQTRQMQMTK
ncbi:Omp28-related outer membrane protein [bacterium]|nr:Omp28-related outer membrane protein [bacterium]